MSVRRAGQRVVFQPYSCVIHFEGLSSGTDVTQGTKRFQEINRVKFMEVWPDELKGLTPNGFRPYLSCDRSRRKHILVVDACTPTPDQDSGSLDMINLLRILVEQNWRVHFVPLANFLHFCSYTDTLQRLGVECVYAPYYRTLEAFLQERGDIFEVCLLARANVASAALPQVERYCPSARTIFYTVDLHFLREQREAELKADREMLRKARETERVELGLMDKVSCTIVMSEVERALLEGRGKKNIRILPLIRDVGTPVSTPVAERCGVLFVGNFQHPPNVDAADWLVGSIWPEVRSILAERGLPLIPLYLVGAKMPKKLYDEPSDDIIPLGYVKDLSEVFEKVRLSVAPLRYGAGLKGKIASSFLYGIPVVGTSVAFEGMPAPGLDRVRREANTERDLARLIVDLHSSTDELASVSEKCRSYAAKHYSIASISTSFSALLDEFCRSHTCVEDASGGRWSRTPAGR
jgi:glycosyltransferase involved in cell wall biosynthesis